ncbi:MAG: alpha/beta fold hydrolase [Phycisphaerae bacterium]|nr:alpha/beta fold hydrolase [Saprospiraceae bacterium]
MKRRFNLTILLSLCALVAFAQNITFQNQTFEAKNVHASIVKLNGEEVLKVERDLNAIPFDVKRLEATVDEPTYVKLDNVQLENGVIEVKMLSRIQNPSPFEFAQGFIGLAFRIDENDKGFESIYLRPKVGRSDNQKSRNKTVQYFAYPDFKFDRLRKEFPEMYETAAPVNINEWITMRIEVNGERVELFVNDAKYSTMIVPKMLGKTTTGGIGLWVDIGTEGYFKDLKIVHGQKNLRRVFQPSNVVNKIPYGNNASAGHFVQADDAKIYYEVYGKGQPMLLLHGGLLGSTVELADFIDRLKDKFQVIAISTRGHGKSELGNKPMTLEQRANDALAVINAVTKDSVLALGFSDGGFTAYQLGAMYPNRIKKMVVIGAGELYPGQRDFNLTSKQAIELDKNYWEQQLKLMPEPQRLEDMFKQVTNFYSKATVGKELLSRIKCPVLVLAGDRDNGNSVEHVVNAARMIQNHQISIIPNAAHGVFLENFAAVWASIEPFLKGTQSNGW